MRAGEGTAMQSEQARAVSLPLYAGGLAVTLCGVQSVCASMGVTEITVAATLLTILGFGFSLVCRTLRIEPRAIEVVCGALIAYILYALVNHNKIFGLVGIDWFVQGADKNEDRLAAGLMWSAVLWSWTLANSESVMFSCVLTAAMIGLTGSVNVNNSTLFWFCLFVLSMTFLLIHQNYLQNRAGAPITQRMLVPRVLRLQAGLSAACAALVLCIGLAVVVPMRASLSQLSVGQALRRLVGSSHIGGNGASLVSERFSDTSGLEIGRGSVWPTSSGIVMHISPSDALPHYWRGRTYDIYTGSGWLSSRQSPVPLAGEEGSEDGRIYSLPTSWIVGEGLKMSGMGIPRPRMTAIVEVRGDTEQFYYADEPRVLQFDTNGGADPTLASDGSLDLGSHAVRGTYAVSSVTPPDVFVPQVQDRLRMSGENYSFFVRHLYLSSLQNGENPTTNASDLAYFRQAVHAALAGLPPSRRTPLDKALAIRLWITRQCTYSLSVDPLPARVDHVHEFLAHARRGYCDMFASSMVVLCRTAGIPARLATGFAPGEPDETGISYNIRALDKHAWAEVYFPGSGWLIFDPTIGSRTDGSVPTDSSSNGSAWPRLLRLFKDNGPLPAALAVAIALCLIYVIKTEAFDQRRKGKHAGQKPSALAPAVQARTDLGRHYSRMTQALARLGLPRRVSETPGEYEARALSWLAQQEEAWGVTLPGTAVSALTSQFSAARYGNLSGGDTRQAERLAAQVTSAAGRLRRARWRIRLLQRG